VVRSPPGSRGRPCASVSVCSVWGGGRRGYGDDVDVDTDEIFRLAGQNRIQLADALADLTEEQWEQPSLCSAWTVRDLTGHLVMFAEVSFGRLLLEVAKHRGSFDRASEKLSRQLARRPVEDLVATLRDNAYLKWAPPGLGPLGPLTDTSVHLRDIARPLGLDVTPPPTTWRLVMDFLVSPRARRGFVPRGRPDGLEWRATDRDWSWGQGPLVAGTTEALAMAITGRPAALADLDGKGVSVLGDRLTGP